MNKDVPGATRDVYDHYVAELKKQNRPTEKIRFASAIWCLIVSKDPAKTFAEAADHIIYQANSYSAWLSAAGLSPLSEHLRDREQLRQSGLLQVVDPDPSRCARDVPVEARQGGRVHPDQSRRLRTPQGRGCQWLSGPGRCRTRPR
jgi:hypothetical protein